MITIRRLANWAHATFDLRDAALAVGLCLLSAGIAQVWMPGAFIVPGAVITWVAIFGAEKPPVTSDE